MNPTSDSTIIVHAFIYSDSTKELYITMENPIVIYKNGRARFIFVLFELHIKILALLKVDRDYLILHFQHKRTRAAHSSLTGITSKTYQQRILQE